MFIIITSNSRSIKPGYNVHSMYTVQDMYKKRCDTNLKNMVYIYTIKSESRFLSQNNSSWFILIKNNSYKYYKFPINGPTLSCPQINQYFLISLSFLIYLSFLLLYLDPLINNCISSITWQKHNNILPFIYFFASTLTLNNESIKNSR